ncbi:hypothetical protein OG304_06795 [Streptomyces sp. NBC_00160]|uniref:hypothetical protein n=1 Tax=Streptomyces sp. NBC_00160 TaxID=2903628 RepID=UPI002250005B|nr:hypothetical protein [Streptomyces sp. NBC_00160]MCX5303160.1 hypothetical protein [Streptomyces sp. NBC_00160]
MPSNLPRTNLAAFAHALAARLPGDAWITAYARHGEYSDQIRTTAGLWDIGAVGYAATNFVLHHEAVLARADGARLLIIDQPLRQRQFMVGALQPDAHHDAFHLVAEPNGITIPADPARAAAQITRRLLPRYEAALRQVRHNTAHPLPRRPAPPLIAGNVSMAWYPDGAIGAVTGNPDATGLLYSHGFQYHPDHRIFLLPASYGDREQLARVQAVSQQLARIGVGVTVRPAPPAPMPTSRPARPPAPAAASSSR